MSKLLDYRDDLIYFHHIIDEKPNPEDFKMHNHNFYEIYYFISGKGCFYIEGSKYPLQNGDLLIMRSTEAHYIAIDPDAPYERFAMHFKKDIINAIDNGGHLIKAFEDREAGKRNMFKNTDFKDSTYIMLLKKIMNPSDSNVYIHTISNLFALLNEIRIAFENSEKEQICEKDTLAYNIIKYINSHLEQKLSLDEICKRFYISKAQLCRIFKKTTGTTVWDYITVKRLSATQSVIMSGVPATKAFAEFGFNDYSAFYRAYCKHFGSSPMQILKKEINDVN